MSPAKSGVGGGGISRKWQYSSIELHTNATHEANNAQVWFLFLVNFDGGQFTPQSCSSPAVAVRRRFIDVRWIVVCR